MRARILALVPLIGALVGALLGAALDRPKPTCIETAICRVKVGSPGGGCLPGPCDGHDGLPVALWVAASAGLVFSLLVAVLYEVLRSLRARPAR
jgi:hypothetical protein